MGSLGLWAGAVLIVGCFVAFGLIYRTAKKIGMSEAERGQIDASLREAKKAMEIRGTVERMPDGAAADELRKSYTR